MLNRLHGVDDVLKVFGGVERYKCVVKNDWLCLCRSKCGAGRSCLAAHHECVMIINCCSSMRCVWEKEGREEKWELGRCYIKRKSSHLLSVQGRLQRSRNADRPAYFPDPLIARVSGILPLSVPADTTTRLHNNNTSTNHRCKLREPRVVPSSVRCPPAGPTNCFLCEQQAGFIRLQSTRVHKCGDVRRRCCSGPPPT